MSQTVHRQCTLCEAHCGIDVEVDGDRVLRITGDAEDPMSRGYICPKAAALADLYADPDRLRRPVRRVGSEWEEIGWDEALDMAAGGLRAVQRRHGNDAVATYFGNPSAHTMAVLSGLPLRHVLNTRNHYSATSTDQLPQHLTSAEMFGNLALFPIPDVDRTDYMLMLGANPSVSNGSLMTAPGARHRLRAIVARGGTVVVVDPRRTETAAQASEYVAIAPGGDPYLLLGMLQVLFAEGRTRLGRLEGHADGIATIEALAANWPVARAAPTAGVDEATVQRLAREFAAAERAVAYGRVGVCQQRTGSLTHWLINVLNAVTGNLDVPGGAMFPNPAFDVGAVLKRARLLGFGDHGRVHAAGQRAARDERRAAGRGPGRRDHDARRGPDPRHADLRRQPGALDAGRRAPGKRARDARVVRGRRHVRHRDDAPCERDPAAGFDARALRHRRRHAARLGAQPHPLQPGRRAEAEGRARGLADPGGAHQPARARGRATRRGGTRELSLRRSRHPSGSSSSASRSGRTASCGAARSRA